MLQGDNFQPDYDFVFDIIVDIILELISSRCLPWLQNLSVLDACSSLQNYGLFPTLCPLAYCLAEG